MTDDAELLLQYARDDSEAAFREFVQRRAAFVYRAALRQCGGRAAEADEIAHAVFLLASRRAGGLSRHPSLMGWLHTVACRLAAQARRREMRRNVRERTAAEMVTPEADRMDWSEVRPVIDQILEKLDRLDREVLLRRFFAEESFAAIATKLGTSEDAARMRLNRALERIRNQLASRQIRSTEAALAAMLVEEFTLGVPAGLAESIAGAVTHAGAAETSLLLMTTSKKAVAIGAAALALAGSGYLAFRQFHEERKELADLARANRDLHEAMAALTARAGRHAADARTSTNAGLNGAGEPDPSVDRLQAAARAVGEALRCADSAATAPKLKMGTRPLRFVGSDTPRHALESFAWASYRSDAAAFAKTFDLDDQARAAAEAILSELPPDVRSQYPTPEAFMGMILAYEAISHPGPDAEDFLDRLPEPTMISPTQCKSSNGLVFVLTPDGWKWSVPASGVTSMAKAVISGAVDATARAQ